MIEVNPDALSIADPRTMESEDRAHQDYRQFLNIEGLKGKRLGVWRGSMGFHEKVDQIMEKSIDLMKSAGAEIVDIQNIPGQDEIGSSGYLVMLYEFKHGLNKYLSTREDIEVRTLEELIAFDEKNRDKSMPYFEQERLLLAQNMGDLDSPEYQEALEKVLRLSRQQGIDQALEENGLDAIIAPTGGPAWPIDQINGDHFRGGSASPAARAGYPSITVPAGYVQGLPVGISLFSTAWKEPELIGMAYAFEQLRGPREVPQFLQTLPLP